MLQGSFYATVHETTIVMYTGGPSIGDGEMLRAIVEYGGAFRLKKFFFHPLLTMVNYYHDQSWLRKPHFLVDGIVHWYKLSEYEHEE
jgi:hypothetical protein